MWHVVCVDAGSAALGRFAFAGGWTKEKAKAIPFTSFEVAHQWARANVGLNTRWVVCHSSVRPSVLLLAPGVA